MSFVQVRGLSFHVQEVGAGPVVAMVHGMLVDNLSLWYFTAAPVLARRHRVLMYDLRGHGKSERAKHGYGLMSQARDLMAILDAKGVEAADLVGHSYGALVALQAAISWPERVRRVVIVEAPLPPSSFDQLQDIMAMESRPEDILAAFPPVLRHALLRGRRRAAKLVDSLRFLLSECSLSQEITDEPDIPDEVLCGVRCPVLLLYGRASGCLDTARRLQRVLPNAHLELLDGGHYLPLDAAEPLVARVAEFLDG